MPDRGDLLGVGYIVQGIRGKNDKIGQLSWFQRPSIGKVQQSRGAAGGAVDRLQRRETTSYHQLQFPVFSKTRDAWWDGAGIGAEGDFYSGVVQRLYVGLVSCNCLFADRNARTF